MAQNILIKTSLDTVTTQFPSVEFADHNTLSDNDLVSRVASGDDTAFEEIFERYKRPVARVVGRFFRERSDIDECVQQSFTKAYFSIRKYRGGEANAFAAWLTRIAVNVCYDELRRRKRSGESFFAEMSDEESGYIATIADGRTVSAEKSLALTQLAEKVLASLDVDDRVAIKLVYSQDYTLDEAADAIGISVSSLKSRLYRCRQQLKLRFGYLFR